MNTATNVEVNAESAQDILKGISIPPRPTLLIEINRILASDDPSITKLAETISKDVGISGAVLKTVNSPLFGLRSKISNVSQALMILGATNVKNIVTGLVLRSSLTGASSVSLERFWDSSEKIASIATFVCSLIPKAPRDEAYMFSIFRDCGIPVLMMRFPNYKETLAAAGGDARPMTSVEEEHHGTNHASVGYLIAKNWGLSPTMCEAIQRHHEVRIFLDSDPISPTALNLISINNLAEHLYDEMLRLRDNRHWELVGNATLDYLGLTETEYSELRDDVQNLIS